MTTRATALAAVARLELSEVRRSRWLVLCLALYAAIAALFVWVGLRESSVLGFTGVGRALFSLCHVLVLLLPLLALLGTAHSVSRSREDGTLELLLSQPLGRGTWLAGVGGVRTLALVVPLWLLLAALAALAFALGQPVPWAFLARAAAVSTALLFAFAGLGLATSVRVRSGSRATSWLLLLWVAAVALLDFGVIALLLQWRLEPRVVFALAAANPVQAARMALLAAADANLATLGPVGFYLANRLGAGALLALGVGWPALVGALAWWSALRGFRRGDVV